MPRRLIGALLCVAAFSLPACSQPSEVQVANTAASQVFEGNLTWLPCGPIECSHAVVPVSYESANSPTVDVAIYRRLATTGKQKRTVFVLPDREFGYSARELVERAPLLLGSASNAFTLIGIAPRGATGSAMPAGSETEIGTLNNADDLELVRKELNLKKVSVLAWGSGATTATAWLYEKPRVIDAAVLDTPLDPATALTAQAPQHIAATKLGVQTAVLWCASHLSCPMNANVAKELNKLKTDIRLQRVPPSVTFDALDRLALSTIAVGEAGPFFTSITKAMNGDATAFEAFAGTQPTLTDAYARCADVSHKDAAVIAAAHNAVVPYKFTIGTEAQLYGMCAQLPESTRPLPKMKPSVISSEAKVMVTVARGDQVTAPSVPRTMAQKMKWQYQSVYANRHLVLTFDAAITAAAMQFLAS
ncbi:unannotated protein [freshwater metagenome]|uniref:Unannotated protein n=1 Tax=freshwater metagenome TaxID=449393 RepID=A0A6J6HYA3_9ZZZZ